MAAVGVGRRSWVPLQEKLSKSLAYILSRQDAVQSHIAELEETIKRTEVSPGGAVRNGAAGLRGCGAGVGPPPSGSTRP